MKHVLLLAGITCIPCLLRAQQKPTGGPGQIVTSADIYSNSDLTTPLSTYILSKDSGYTTIFGYEDVGGCDPYNPNARVIVAVDDKVVDSTHLSQYGTFQLPIILSSIDTGRHVISYSFDAFQYGYADVIHHNVDYFVIHVRGSVAAIPATPPPAVTPTIPPTPRTLCLYPNPAHDSVFIAPLDSSETQWLLDVSDSRGNIIGHFQGSDSYVAVPTTTLQPGLYYAELKTYKRSYKTKFEVAGK